MQDRSFCAEQKIKGLPLPCRAFSSESSKNKNRGAQGKSERERSQEGDADTAEERDLISYTPAHGPFPQQHTELASEMGCRKLG